MYWELPIAFYKLMDRKENLVLLETSKYDEENYKSLLFIDPLQILKADEGDELPYLFDRIEEYLSKGCYLAGYLSYECGYHFEEIATDSIPEHPIAWFGIYKRPIVFDHLTGTFNEEAFRDGLDINPLEGDYRISGLHLSISKKDYLLKVKRIKEYLLSGDTYEINFTCKYRFNFYGNPIALYCSLKEKQRVSYGAFIKSGLKSILSLSPELFFKLKDGRITVKPMKGTIKRGRTLDEDSLLANSLKNNEKDRAENLMIVDLLRNDLGKITEIGSVKIAELYSIEKYRTLFQMVSVIEGILKKDLTYYNIFRAIFPSGSVTGAPKVRSIQIIDELEDTRRGIYTGAIGYISPYKEAVFNVAIRTVVIEGNNGEMGVGSGIVSDSLPEYEYEECRLKAQFLTIQDEEFELIETILWDNGYPLLEKHMERLRRSAEYFDYSCDINRIVSALVKHSQDFKAGAQYKVRLRLSRSGEVSLENSLIKEDQNSLMIILSGVTIDSNDKFLYHKTTHRRLYDKMYQKTQKDGFADIIFMNEKGEITEGAISNIFIKKDGYLITPPVECGLLNGVYRQYLMEIQSNTVEKVLSLKDLQEAEAIYICNAVRGLRRVRLHSGKRMDG